MYGVSLFISFAMSCFLYVSSLVHLCMDLCCVCLYLVRSVFVRDFFMYVFRSSVRSFFMYVAPSFVRGCFSYSVMYVCVSFDPSLVLSFFSYVRVYLVRQLFSYVLRYLFSSFVRPFAIC